MYTHTQLPTAHTHTNTHTLAKQPIVHKHSLGNLLHTHTHTRAATYCTYTLTRQPTAHTHTHSVKQISAHTIKHLVTTCTDKCTQNDTDSYLLSTVHTQIHTH